MRTTYLVTLLVFPAVAHADDVPLHVDPTTEECEVRFAPGLTQASYHRFAREFGSASAFKQMGSPLVLAKKRLSFGVEYMAFSIDDRSDAWNDTFVHPDSTHWLGSDLRFPKVKLRVGLGANTDVGAYYTMNPHSNYGWIGIDAKHALLRQSDAMPVSVAVRGAYTKTLFVDDMDMHALSTDVSVGRTLPYGITPYLGLGADMVLARETSPMVELDTEYVTASHAFAGVEVALWRMIIGAEALYATIPTAQAQVAFVF